MSQSGKVLLYSQQTMVVVAHKHLVKTEKTSPDRALHIMFNPSMSMLTIVPVGACDQRHVFSNNLGVPDAGLMVSNPTMIIFEFKKGRAMEIPAWIDQLTMAMGQNSSTGTQRCLHGSTSSTAYFHGSL